MIMVGSDVPVCLVGDDLSRKSAARTMVLRCIVSGDRLVTDAAALQEILQSCVAIGAREAIRPAYHAMLGIVDEVIPVVREDVMRARDIIVDGDGQVAARCAVHAAVMERGGIGRIMSLDSGFDAIPGIERIHG